MAIENKKFEEFYKTTGGGNDKISDSNLAKAEKFWDDDRANGCSYYLSHPDFAPLIFQMQQMQRELDYLRTEILSNKNAKNTLTIGTGSNQAKAGNTATISPSQATAIGKILPVTLSTAGALVGTLNSTAKATTLEISFTTGKTVKRTTLTLT